MLVTLTLNLLLFCFQLNILLTFLLLMSLIFLHCFSFLILALNIILILNCRHCWYSWVLILHFLIFLLLFKWVFSIFHINIIIFLESLTSILIYPLIRTFSNKIIQWGWFYLFLIFNHHWLLNWFDLFNFNSFSCDFFNHNLNIFVKTLFIKFLFVFLFDFAHINNQLDYLLLPLNLLFNLLLLLLLRLQLLSLFNLLLNLLLQ